MARYENSNYLLSMPSASHFHTCPKHPSPSMLNTFIWWRGISHLSIDFVFNATVHCKLNMTVGFVSYVLILAVKYGDLSIFGSEN